MTTNNRRVLFLCAASLLSGGGVEGFVRPTARLVSSPSFSSIATTSSSPARSFLPAPLLAVANATEVSTSEETASASLVPPLSKDEEDEATLTTTTTTTTTSTLMSATTTIADDDSSASFDEEYKRGFLTIAFITFLNASLSPVWHVVFEGNGPPPLFLNAVVSSVALMGLLGFAPLLDSQVASTSALADTPDQEKWGKQSFRGGIELGLWKGLGTTCHIYGMALTTANHGAFLLQLTTLIVPVLQGLRGAEKIPRQIQAAVVLALLGIYAFTQDPTSVSDIVSGDASQIQLGDALVLGAAFFYSIYDIQTFYWGREVPRTELVTIKVGFQALLSLGLCAIAARPETMDYLTTSGDGGPDWIVFVPTVLWTGLIVNALATFLQVGGMQAVGPTRAQTIFASQPLWASIMNYVFLGATMGLQGFVGGGSFLGALFLAATAEAPTPIVDDDNDEVLEVKMADGSSTTSL
mmetsp:Transcript_39870/g.59145  ORF Transcript_39870/g.59145 Transcript_39870/m.59145 type:complete len:467 (-) Transcript_39870:333-1733(-)|eukprot:CAMPEP_0194048790 /NCGR_PEP_ID=MMETSP0009_2-20130614/28542_1 /TAXON_ID=210454 /ORGANISM="Grammatophora oceanica, Strain CCMP 410" /LENGTH=466 /DNA_ID=CAMNT_0038694769 /DNA_START=287 /DNA_END=1687 /DNA_ORIENTATION=-